MTTTARPAPASATALRVLLVEDDHLTREVLTAALAACRSGVSNISEASAMSFALSLPDVGNPMGEAS
jgi:hypothetical protein